MDKLVITKALRSGYKNPKQISHKVLADRIGKRDPGNKPAVGDRVSFVFIEHPNKKALQGEKIETPTFIKENNLKIDYSFYITNQIMKPVLQLYSLCLTDLCDYKECNEYWDKVEEELRILDEIQKLLEVEFSITRE